MKSLVTLDGFGPSFCLLIRSVLAVIHNKGSAPPSRGRLPIHLEFLFLSDLMINFLACSFNQIIGSIHLCSSRGISED